MNPKCGIIKKQIVITSIANFSWDRAFLNQNVNEMFHVFNKTIKMSFLTSFLMRLLFIMRKTLLGSSPM